MTRDEVIQHLDSLAIHLCYFLTGAEKYATGAKSVTVQDVQALRDAVSLLSGRD